MLFGCNKATCISPRYAFPSGGSWKEGDRFLMIDMNTQIIATSGKINTKEKTSHRYMIKKLKWIDGVDDDECLKKRKYEKVR